MSEKLLPLETIRHSAAHVLAQAVLQLFPSAKLGFGPAIEEGFYYDFELEEPLTDTHLKELEKRMKKIIKQKQTFSQYDLKTEETLVALKKHNQNYKVELVNDLKLKEYSFYENGPFVDLCRGPHVDHTGQIGAVKLLSIAGAYWKGSEKNIMLQRIYGTAFHTKDELQQYLERIEEAKKRDHRAIGKSLDLFSINEDIGGGLILWHPKGSHIRHLIEEYWKKIHFDYGYELLYTPHTGRSTLWETSGHLEFYKEGMYSPMNIDEQDYYLKPMNCPFHSLIYNTKQRSYRDLPVRFAELGTVYRYERSGVLHGLMRVRGFTQDDAHIICTPDQVQDEILNVMKLAKQMLTKFGFEKIKIFLSTRPLEKYVGDLNLWAHAENALKDALTSLNIDYEIDEGGGAFYGPKIDIKIEDAIGREWQCSTVQFDFNLPERFDMTYIDNNGEKKRPYMIHRALLGSIERFFGILVEHFAGKFPLWLAPVQVKILSITSDVHNYSEDVMKKLQEAGFRVEHDHTSEKIGYKIRQATQQKIPYLIILGKKEEEEKSLAIRVLGEGDRGEPLKLEKFIEELKNNL